MEKINLVVTLLWSCVLHVRPYFQCMHCGTRLWCVGALEARGERTLMENVASRLATAPSTPAPATTHCEGSSGAMAGKATRMRNGLPAICRLWSSTAT